MINTHRALSNLALYFIVLSLFSSTCIAQITLPKVFGDNMVLQRDKKIPVWGKATPGVKLTVELGTERVTTVADKDGKWTANLPKFKAGGPYSLKVLEAGKPEQTVEFENVLIGDVWLALGQSNMELQVQQAKDAKNEIKTAKFSQIRILFVAHDKMLTPLQDIMSGKWKVCDATNVKVFSAVAKCFAREIHTDQNVPIGIVQI